MDIWKQICARESARLESVLELYKHAGELAGHGAARQWIRPDDLKRLEAARKTIAQKLARLKSGEFHIAVVGTEKAGKSTFINAWLESDLLPNKPARCTFTTTRLHSVAADGRQCLMVRPKSREEFDVYCEQLEKEAQGTGKEADNAREDLEMIAAHRDQMLALIEEGDREIPFDDLEQISPDLERYAADGSYAHAVREVDLYTKSLARMDGVLFYDVPGLNSGLSKHERETREMLEDSDAVIIVKSADRPSIDGDEKQILRYAESDTSIPLKDKVFFFCSKIDKESTREGLLKNRDEFLADCAGFGISEKNVFYGSAPVVLHLKNRLRDTKYISSREELKHRLMELLALPDESDETILENAGVKPIHDRIEDYLEHDREKILKSSVDGLVREIEQGAAAIHDAVRAHVPDNPEEMRYKHEETVAMQFGEWFDNLWEEITSALSEDKSASLVRDCIARMESAYQANVEDKLANLPHFQPERQNTFFSSEKAKRGAEDYQVFNANLRMLVNKETMSAMQELSGGLSWDLYSQLTGYINELSAKFNDSLDVKERLFAVMGIKDGEEYRHQLESALSALFLRLVRPLARALMKHRHGLPERREEVRQFGGIYRSLSELYPDDMPDKYADLPRYLVHGAAVRQEGRASDSAKDAARKAGSKLGEKLLRRASAPAADGTEDSRGVAGEEVVADRTGNAADVSYTSREDIVNELEEDREALKIYLLHAVFGCSGIGDYADQELLRIREKFIVDCARNFRDMAGAAFRSRNPKFMALVPPNLRDTSCDTQVAERLQQLSTALRQRNVLV